MRMFLGYHFGDFELAKQMSDLLLKAGLDKGHFHAVAQFGYIALTHLALARNAPLRQQKSMLRHANKHIELLNKMAKTGNLNVARILQLCIAERAALAPDANVDEVQTFYSKAIASASRTGILHEAAMANERAGLFMLHRGDPARAKTHFLRAGELYAYWGARAKVDQLRENYNINESDMEHWKDSSEGILGRNKFSAVEANKHTKRFLNRRKSLPRTVEDSHGNV